MKTQYCITTKGPERLNYQFLKLTIYNRAISDGQTPGTLLCSRAWCVELGRNRMKIFESEISASHWTCKIYQHCKQCQHVEQTLRWRKWRTLNFENKALLLFLRDQLYNWMELKVIDFFLLISLSFNDFRCQLQSSSLVFYPPTQNHFHWLLLFFILYYRC